MSDRFQIAFKEGLPIQVDCPRCEDTIESSANVTLYAYPDGDMTDVAVIASVEVDDQWIDHECELAGEPS